MSLAVRPSALSVCQRPSIPYIHQMNTNKQYIFGEITYGGHIVNDVDRLLARTYLEHLMRVRKTHMYICIYTHVHVCAVRVVCDCMDTHGLVHVCGGLCVPACLEFVPE